MRLSPSERFVAAGVVFLVFSGSVSAWAAQETEQVNQTVAFPSGGRLELRNFSGDVRIVGTTRNDLVIRAVRRAERDRLDHIKLDVQASSGGVTINANKRDAGWSDRDNNVVETTFDIEVPQSARLDVEVFSSDLDVRGVRGPLMLKTFSGEVTVDATAAGQSPEITARTFSGHIRARLAGTVNASVSFDSFSGRLDTTLPLMLRSSSRRRVSGTITGGGDANATLNFHTFSGNVTIDK